MSQRTARDKCRLCAGPNPLFIVSSFQIDKACTVSVLPKMFTKALCLSIKAVEELFESV
jgi:hypothetical protein